MAKGFNKVILMGNLTRDVGTGDNDERPERS